VPGTDVAKLRVTTRPARVESRRGGLLGCADASKNGRNMPLAGRLILALLGAAAGAGAQTLPIDYFTHAADLGRVQISPDGRFLAATHEVEGQGRLAFLNLEQLGDVVEVVAPDGTDFHDFHWISPVRVIYRLAVRQPGIGEPITTGELYAIDRDGTNAQYVYGCTGGTDDSPEPAPNAAVTPAGPEDALADATCGTAELLSLLPDDDRDVLVAQYLWQRDGERFIADPDASPIVSRIDTYDASIEVLEPLSLRAGRVLVDESDRPRFIAGRDEVDALTIAWRPAQGDSWRSFRLEAFDPEAFQPARLTPDGAGAVAVARRIRGERAALYRIDLERGAARLLYAHPDVDVGPPVLDLEGDHVVGVRVEAERPAYHWLDPSDRTARLYATIARAFPGHAVEITSVTADQAKVIAYVQSDVNPGDYYIVDTKTREAQYLRSARSWVDPAKMRPKEPFELKARDGTTLHGYLTRPDDGDGPYPLLVVPHPGPYGVRDRWAYDWQAQLFAHYGYAVLQVNYRGSAGYGEDFARAGLREWGAKMQDDLTDATRWAVARGYAREGGACLFGVGYGGYAALMGLVREPDLYRCAVGFDGLYDLTLVMQAGNVSAAARARLEEIFGTDPDVLRARSPVNRAAEIRDPVLLIVAGTTSRAEHVHANRLRDALRAMNKEVETAGVDGITAAYTRAIEFLERKLRRPLTQEAPGSVRPAG
jgi:dipeptidyl aminopeptidase/acylaminoacyl peptidase